MTYVNALEVTYGTTYSGYAYLIKQLGVGKTYLVRVVSNCTGYCRQTVVAYPFYDSEASSLELALTTIGFDEKSYFKRRGGYEYNPLVVNFSEDGEVEVFFDGSLIWQFGDGAVLVDEIKLR